MTLDPVSPYPSDAPTPPVDSQMARVAYLLRECGFTVLDVAQTANVVTATIAPVLAFGEDFTAAVDALLMEPGVHAWVHWNSISGCQYATEICVEVD